MADLNLTAAVGPKSNHLHETELGLACASAYERHVTRMQTDLTGLLTLVS